MNPRTADLFDQAPAQPPICRRQDPVTSKQGGTEYTATKRRGKDQQLMFDLIFENPGLTAGEYGNILLERGMKPMKAIRMPTKRISDLLHDHRLIIGKTRKCSVSKRNARTYFAKPE